MRFKNRSDAGKQLATKLMPFADQKDVLVLGIPRGGAPVAYEVAIALHAQLDIFLSRKLGVPANPELAFGAVAADDGRFLDRQIVTATGVTQEEIARITEQTRRMLDDRALMYRKGRARIAVEGRTLILIDDGIATGSSMYAAVRALRQMKPKKLIVAVPVAPRETCARLQPEVDLLVVLQTPADFYAVGQFYEDFRETLDNDVIELLEDAKQLGKLPGDA